MKKLAALFLTALLTTSAFAEFFQPRFFELEVGVPVCITNNAFMLDDILQEQAVIDFGKMANSLPKSGFTILNTVNPYLGMNCNLGDLSAGFKTELDLYQKYNLSKDFFNFIGKGNELNEEMTFAMTFNLDAFYGYSGYLALPFGKFRVKMTPTVFTPLIHITTEDSRLVINNTEDGRMSVDFKASGKMYTYNNFDGSSGYYPNEGYGMDLGTEVSYPVFDGLVVTGNIRTPVAPGHLHYVSSIEVSAGVESKLLDYADFANLDYSPDIQKGFFEETSYAINRPFKLGVLADLSPMGDFLHLYGGSGLGVRNPFSKSTKATWYPEYYFGVCVKAGYIASCTVSTEYTDQLFKHTLEGTVNVRVFELDMGISMASASLASSFRGAGFAGYVVTKWGF